MPIAFTSHSHGQIAVGFFNIETDMLLMDRYFFFATDFSARVKAWVSDPDRVHDEWSIYVIPNPDLIGNLAGAIYGFELSGFIGEVYKRYPFPEERAGFKQKPYGYQNQNLIREIIRPFATQSPITVTFLKTDRNIRIGDYVFSKAVFQDIIHYVDAGGMPGWLDGQPPRYVKEMINALDGSKHWFFT